MLSPETRNAPPLREHYTNLEAYNHRRMELDKDKYKIAFGYSKTQEPSLSQDLEEQAIELSLGSHEVVIVTCDEHATLFYK